MFLKSQHECVYPFRDFAVEELTCLATWKDGNSRYLVGLVSHHHAISNEERYRCFVYEKILPSNGEFFARTIKNKHILGINTQ